MSVISEFYSGLLDKGYTEREIRESCKRHQERVAPDWFNGTYAEYLDSMHDFLNGLWNNFKTIQNSHFMCLMDSMRSRSQRMILTRQNGKHRQTLN